MALAPDIVIAPGNLIPPLPQLLDGSNDSLLQPQQKDELYDFLDDNQYRKTYAYRLDAGPTEQQVENDQVEQQDRRTGIAEPPMILQKFTVMPLKVTMELLAKLASFCVRLVVPLAVIAEHILTQFLFKFTVRDA